MIDPSAHFGDVLVFLSLFVDTSQMVSNKSLTLLTLLTPTDTGYQRKKGSFHYLFSI